MNTGLRASAERQRHVDWSTRAAWGAALIVIAAWIFGGVIADALRGVSIGATDHAVAAWWLARRSPPLTDFMRAVSTLHDTLAVCAYTAVAALIFLARGEGGWILRLLVAVPGGMLLNGAVKHAIQRARPEGHALQTLLSFSFPSGHTAAATLFYGFLAVYVCTGRQLSAPARGGVLLGAAAMAMLVGASRIYLGVHYFSDVVGAAIECSIWLAICLAGGLPPRAAHAAQATGS